MKARRVRRAVHREPPRRPTTNEMVRQHPRPRRDVAGPYVVDDLEPRARDVRVDDWWCATVESTRAGAPVERLGVEREWIQGFFSQHDAQRQYPTACVTCPQIYQPHQFINEQAWYTFETGNLFDLLIPAERPAYISRFEFYASGHEYDVFVSEVVLLGGQLEVIPPNENIVPINPTASAGG